MTTQAERCGICGHVLRRWEDRDGAGSNHANCTESSVGERRSNVRRVTSMQNLVRRWWGTGQH